jgi:hypothetical protein
VRFVDPGHPWLLSEIPLPLAILHMRGAVTTEDEWALAMMELKGLTHLVGPMIYMRAR